MTTTIIPVGYNETFTDINHAGRETVNHYLRGYARTRTYTALVTCHTRNVEYVPCDLVQAVLLSPREVTDTIKLVHSEKQKFEQTNLQ
jgi:hypothetical protein